MFLLLGDSEMLDAVVLLCLLSAPAPMPKGVPPARVEGAHALLWGFAPKDGDICTLAPGGTWECWWSGCRWTGTWRLEGRTLHVEERQLPEGAFDEWTPAAPSIKWSAELKECLREGTLSTGGVFRLNALPR